MDKIKLNNGIKCAKINFATVAEGRSKSYQNEKDNEKCQPCSLLLGKITTAKEGNKYAHQLIKHL